MLLVWSAVMVGGAAPARACSCLAADPVDKLREADAAFVGTLVGKDEPTTSNGAISSAQSVGYHFQVDQLVKGRLGSRVTVYAALDGASCGLEFHGSPSTGMLLTDDGGRWRSSLCQQVTPLQLLAAGGVPAERPESGTHPGSVALVVALLGALALVARRSVRRSG